MKRSRSVELSEESLLISGAESEGDVDVVVELERWEEEDFLSQLAFQELEADWELAAVAALDKAEAEKRTSAEQLARLDAFAVPDDEAEAVTKIYEEAYNHWNLGEVKAMLQVTHRMVIPGMLPKVVPLDNIDMHETVAQLLEQRKVVSLFTHQVQGSFCFCFFFPSSHRFFFFFPHMFFASARCNSQREAFDDDDANSIWKDLQCDYSAP